MIKCETIINKYGKTLRKYYFMDNRLGSGFVETTYLIGVQRAFEENKFDGRGNLDSYLHKRGIWFLLNEYRREIAHENDNLHIDGFEGDGAGNNRDFADYLNKTTQDENDYAIYTTDLYDVINNKLTDKQKKCCMMLANDYTHKEIAEEMNITRQSVEKMIRRIKKVFVENNITY